nr:MAG TPA: Protein of unknown function (DUF3612) [Caudoviricetes sp.]
MVSSNKKDVYDGRGIPLPSYLFLAMNISRQISN